MCLTRLTTEHAKELVELAREAEKSWQARFQATQAVS